MAGRFGEAFARGMLMAGAIAAGILAMVLIVGLPESDDLFLQLFLVLGLLSIVFTGSALSGAFVGAAAGHRAANVGVGAGAGAVAGLVGQFVIVLAVFVAFAIVDAAHTEPATEEDPFFEEDPEEDETLAWGEFGKALLVLVPSTIAASIAGAATAPWGKSRPHRAPSPVRPGPAPGPLTKRHLRCPSCGNTVATLPGEQPVCDACGYGRRAD